MNNNPVFRRIRRGSKGEVIEKHLADYACKERGE